MPPSPTRFFSLVFFSLLWTLGFPLHTYGITNISPPGSWGDPCFQQKEPSTGSEKSSAEKLFQEGLKASGPWGVGKIIPRDPCEIPSKAQTRKLFTLAAQQGHAGSAYLLGWIYQDGWGVQADPKQAKQWFEKSIELDPHPGAMLKLGLLWLEGINGTTDNSIAFKWISQAATIGNNEAAYQLSLMYEYGLGVVPDPGKALHWLQKAAMDRSFKAWFALGKRMLEGNGVPKNQEKGLELIQKAASRRVPEALLYLGSALLTAERVPPDREKGEKLLQQALEEAVINGNNEMVKGAIQAGVSPNYHYQGSVSIPTFSYFQDPIAQTVFKPSIEKVPILSLAAETDRADTARLLIKSGAKVNAQRTLTKKTPLWSAANRGHVKVLETLLELGADPNIPSVAVDGQPSHTPLETARAMGHSKVVEVLKKANAIERQGLLNAKALSRKLIEYRALETNKLRPEASRRILTPLPDYFNIFMKDASTTPSTWIELQKNQSKVMLQNKKFDVLVVPFQVQNYGIDPIGRSLMTAYLAKHLQRTAGLKLPDPYLVKKALGENLRTYPKEQVYQLAQDLGVQTIIWGYVGHDRASDMRLTLQVQHKDESGLFENTPMAQWDSEILLFSDEVPPEEVFLQIVPQISKNLDFPSNVRHAVSNKKSIDSRPPPVPQSPQDFINLHSTNPTHQAYYLQMLGTLFPKDADRAKERLFEKSLIALNDLSPDTPGLRLLKARALLHLHRRPAALTVLGHPLTPEEKAMLALLNGNLPELEKHILEIKAPINHFLTIFDLIDLRYEYMQNEDNTADQQFLSNRFPEWAPLIERRAVDRDYWHSGSNILVKTLLDQTFPLKDESLQDLVHGAMVLQEPFPSFVMIEESVLSHIQKLVEIHSTKWCCSNVLSATIPLDYLDLLASFAEANLLHRIWHQYGTQGDNNAAVKILDQIEPLYEGHPALTQLRSSIGLSIIQSDKRNTNSLALRRHYQGFVNAMIWSGGQTRASSKAVWAERDISPLFSKMSTGKKPLTPRLWILYATDVPRRSFWPMGGSHSMNQNNFEHYLKYTHDDFYQLQSAYDWFTDTIKDASKAKALLETHAHRFIGHPDRLAWLAQTQIREGNLEEGINQYQAAISQKTTDWEPYGKLGNLLITEGRFEEASKVFESFPKFHEMNPKDRVYVSNLAYEAGSLLFWRGAAQMAIPLYRLSARLGTGSDSSLSSKIRLAMLEEDFQMAAKTSLIRAKRYDSHYAYRDYLSLLHLLGFSKESWAGFSNLLGKYESPQIWTSAFVGHHIQGTSDQDITSWLDEQENRSPLHAFKSFPARFAFMISNIDRAPNLDMIEQISKYEARYPAKFDSHGNIINLSDEIIGPSNYNQSSLGPPDSRLKRPKLQNDFFQTRAQANQPVDSELVLFAKAYTALRTKDYSTALQWFEKRARFYSYSEESHTEYALPYFSWAAIKSEKGEHFRVFLDEFKKPRGARDWYQGFDYFLAEAFWAGGQGHHSKALTFLHQAFNHRPHTEMRPIFSWYQVVEACEILFEDSGEEEYRKLALQWAKEYQVIQPMFAWAYGVEAKYSNNSLEKQRALALALFLDRRSERIQGIPNPEKQKALEWLKTNNPFKKLPTSTKKVSM